MENWKNWIGAQKPLNETIRDLSKKTTEIDGGIHHKQEFPPPNLTFETLASMDKNEFQNNLCCLSLGSRSAIFWRIRGALPPVRLLMIRFTWILSFIALLITPHNDPASG